MKIKSITIDGIHNAKQKHYEFNNLSYLYGPNGAGKSTVLQSIQLAILGYIPDSGKTKESIWKHANLASGKMSIECEFDNGVTVKRTWTDTGKSVVSAVTINPATFNIEGTIAETGLPVYDFKEFTNMTSNKLKEWFIGFLPESSSAIDWKQLFSDELAANGLNVSENHLNTILEGLVDHTSGVSSVRFANDYLKSQLTAEKSVLERLQNTSQSLCYYDDASSDESMIMIIQEEIDKLNLQIQESNKALQIKNQNDRIRSEMDRYKLEADSFENDPEYSPLTDAISEEQVVLNTLSIKLEKLVEEYSNINSEIKSMTKIASSKGICPYTASECKSISELSDEYKSKIEELQASLVKINSEITAAQESIQKSKSYIAMSKSKLNNLKYAYDQVANYKSILLEVDESVIVDTSELTQILNMRINELSRIQANIKYQEVASDIENQIYESEEIINCLKVLIKLTDANHLQTDMMNKPFTDLADTMSDVSSEFFGEGSKISFNLSSKANSFSFGLITNETYIPFETLSSGEKCMFTLALVTTIVRCSSDELKTVIIDDSLDHLDDDNINKVFEVLSSIEDVQYIFAGVKNFKSMKDFTIQINKE